MKISSFRRILIACGLTQPTPEDMKFTVLKELAARQGAISFMRTRIFNSMDKNDLPEDWSLSPYQSKGLLSSYDGIFILAHGGHVVAEIQKSGFGKPVIRLFVNNPEDVKQVTTILSLLFDRAYIEYASASSQSEGR